MLTKSVNQFLLDRYHLVEFTILNFKKMSCIC